MAKKGQKQKKYSVEFKISRKKRTKGSRETEKADVG